MDLAGLEVLMWMPSASEIPGGHVIQSQSTARALRGLGISVTETVDQNPPLAGIDVVHGFGLSPQQAARCRREGTRLAISTIYWGLGYRAPRLGRPLDLGLLRSTTSHAARTARAALISHEELIRRSLRVAAAYVDNIVTYATADVLLPNARGEGEAIRRELGVHTQQCFVPNAVSLELFPPEVPQGQRREGVLCVGRIEPHKNQLGLIEALEGAGVPLTIAGPPHPHHDGYYRACRKAGRGWVNFVDSVPQGELADLYTSAQVHVLPSWFETTGLVSLEASMCGCTVVSTSRGYAREYLGNEAFYCDPADEGSIKRAVRAALQQPPSSALRDRIVANYTWRHTAQATATAYARVLSS